MDFQLHGTSPAETILSIRAPLNPHEAGELALSKKLHPPLVGWRIVIGFASALQLDALAHEAARLANAWRSKQAEAQLEKGGA